MKKFTSVEEYYLACPANMQQQIQEMRSILKAAAPKATEVISYNMPAIKQNKVLVYFAACKEHIGFYPTAAPIVAFKEVLRPYKTSKGAIQLPAGKALPNKLICDIVNFRIQQIEQIAEQKKIKK